MADTVVLRFVCNPYTNLRTSVSTAVSELCCAPPWCAPPGLSEKGKPCLCGHLGSEGSIVIVRAHEIKIILQSRLVEVSFPQGYWDSMETILIAKIE